MKEVTLFTVPAPHREPMEVRGWQFGDPEKRTLAVMGALRGNEIQQMYVCSVLIRRLKEIEAAGQLSAGIGILIVPCANAFSMNVGKRFWASDNTDINRMFPGYDEGETTQRIADRIFKSLQDYSFGVHLVSLYLPGDILPHVRVMETGYEDISAARLFGMPCVMLHTPEPFDTTTLNYNWQIWGTHSFSLYTKETYHVNPESARQCSDAVLRFLFQKGYSAFNPAPQTILSPVHHESEMDTVVSEAGGLLMQYAAPGDHVEAGALLGEIQDPCDGEILQLLKAKRPGLVFFAHYQNLINGHEAAFRVIPDGSRKE